MYEEDSHAICADAPPISRIPTVDGRFFKIDIERPSVTETKYQQKENSCSEVCRCDVNRLLESVLLL